MENKPTIEELLRQQLELLAERSANEASVEQLPQLTLAMVEICNVLWSYKQEDQFDIDSILDAFTRRAEKITSKLIDADV